MGAVEGQQADAVPVVPRARRAAAPDLPDFELRQPPRGSVVLRGPVAEITMHAFGREAVRDVQVLGDPADVEAYQAVKLGM